MATMSKHQSFIKNNMHNNVEKTSWRHR